MKIKGIKKISYKKSIQVYDLSVENNHNFAISAGNSIIHNCCYLHGNTSMESVVVGLAQNFVGSNNIPLFERKGHFGTRFETEASAPRYIKTKKEKYLDKIFRSEDEDILDEQIFEGYKIEPKFFIPVIPMILVNGSQGPSTGFAQKILPRNPKELIKFLIDVLTTGEYKSAKNIIPWYRGFKGKIKATEEEKSWEIFGNIEKINSNTYIINEVPIGYDLNEYKKELDKIEEKGIITSYNDLSTDDRFKFEIKVKRNSDVDIHDVSFLESLKLVKRVTENYTCCNENLSITEFKNIDEILQAYINIRKKYLEKRKICILKKIYYDIVINASKFFFIKGVVEGIIKIQNVKYDEIIEQLKKYNNIKPDEKQKYDYLLNMPVHSLTTEKYEGLKVIVNNLKIKYKELQEKTIEQIWIEELNELMPVVEGMLK